MEAPIETESDGHADSIFLSDHDPNRTMSASIKSPAPAPLWTASEQLKATHPYEAFRKFVNHRLNKHISSYDEMHKFSVTDVEDFWNMVWDFSNITGRKFDKVRACIRRPWLELPCSSCLPLSDAGPFRS